MKSKITLAFALLVGAFLAGCESSAKLNSIRIGMTKAEVQSILGTPDSTSAQANVEYMTYYLEAEAGYGRDQPYMIRLVNGKVESFGRFAQLFDLYNRPVTSATPGQPDFPQPTYNLGNPMLPAPIVVRTDNPAARVDLVAELEKLKALKDQGVLTDDEFQRAKAKLLSQP
ncbi:MAG TPA: SHOCT domain-containing protein [Opitutaceae bacterium]|nr:SHOCT domain-containing protein [Opitutaceae bacterium]